MRWLLLAVSCLSLSRAVPIPTSPITVAPETRAPPTLVPLSCASLLYSPLVASVEAPIKAEYVECWTFQCVGTVEVTFSNITTDNRGGRVSLQNSDRYVLTSLVDNRERYIATYPANGEMTVVFNGTRGDSNYYENEFTFEWECNTGPAVVPAAGFDASTYLTLPPAGSYKRMFSEQAIYSWIIPCTGTLEISAFAIPTSNPHSSPYFRYGVELALMNSNGTVVYSHWGSSTVNGIFSVAGNFNITLHIRNQGSYDSEMAFAWSCGRPLVPRSPCESLSSPPLVASIQVPIRASYSECWTFQCVGTVEVTFSNITTDNRGGRVSLQNSDGYVLTSLIDNRERYIATYPANGEMMVVFNDTSGDSYGNENEFTFEWECNTGPAVVPAAGFDASTYLTLPPAGWCKRMFSKRAMYSWIIPCTGTLDIAASAIPSSSPHASPAYLYGIELALMNSNGTVVYSHWGSSTVNGIFSVAGNFNITLHTRTEGSYDSEMVFAWSCGRPLVPRSPCESLSLPPLVASVKAPIGVPYSECWTFQCVGTVEVTFSNITTDNRGGRVSLHNSDGYVLTSFVDNRERYIATYPANGEMMVVFKDTSGYSYYYENVFTFEWECHTGPAVVPAAGFDASTYLTLPPAGSYKRMFSEQAIYSWIIPCTGTLDIAASAIPSSSPHVSSDFWFGIELALMNSNGTVVYSHWGSSTVNGIFSVAGNFNVTLHTRTEGSYDSEMVFAWSCAATSTATPTGLPAGDTFAPSPTLSPMGGGGGGGSGSSRVPLIVMSAVSVALLLTGALFMLLGYNIKRSAEYQKADALISDTDSREGNTEMMRLGETMCYVTNSPPCGGRDRSLVYHKINPAQHPSTPSLAPSLLT